MKVESKNYEEKTQNNDETEQFINNENDKNNSDMEPARKPPTTWEIIKLILGSQVGTILEWYDFTIFGLFAKEIGVNFFPTKHCDINDNECISNQNTLHLLESFTVFVIGFIFRPFGGIILGYIGDKFGRLVALRISLVLISIPTCLVGCLPTYSSVGIISTILLLIIRILQGLSLGGEFVGCITYLYEMSPKNKLYTFVALAESSSSIGILIGCWIRVIMSIFITQEKITNFWWRLPFWIGILCGIIGLIMRQLLNNSIEFEKSKKLNKLHNNPLCYILQNHKIRMFFAFLHLSFQAIYFYWLCIWVPQYLYNLRKNRLQNAYVLQTIINFVYIIFNIIGGWFCDMFGLFNVLMIGGSICLLMTGILFIFIEIGNDITVWLVTILFSLLYGIYSGTTDAQCIAILEDTETRYIGMGITYNIAMAVFGGTAPLLGTYMQAKYGFYSFCIYMISVGVMSLLCNGLWKYNKSKQNNNSQIIDNDFDVDDDGL